MTGCQAVQPQGQGSDRGRGEERQRGDIELDSCTLPFFSWMHHQSVFTMHTDTRTTSTQLLPQRNNPKWWLLLHFPSLPLCLSYYASVTLFPVLLSLLLSLYTFMMSTSTDPRAHPDNTHSFTRVLYASFIFPRATETEARCSGLLVFPLQLMHYSAMNRSVT